MSQTGTDDQWAAALAAQAREELDLVAGGRALCRITSAGAPGVDVKRAEGRWAALSALSRQLRAQPAADPRTVCSMLVSQWQSDLDRWRGQPGSSWIPYCEGGLAALQGAADEQSIRYP